MKVARTVLRGGKAVRPYLSQPSFGAFSSQLSGPRLPRRLVQQPVTEQRHRWSRRRALVADQVIRRIEVHRQIVFVIAIIEPGRGHGLPADALVLPGPVLIAVLRVGRVAVAELVRGAQAELSVTCGRRHVGLE